MPEARLVVAADEGISADEVLGLGESEEPSVEPGGEGTLKVELESRFLVLKALGGGLLPRGIAPCASRMACSGILGSISRRAEEDADGACGVGLMFAF